jgi:hypothetical protein
MAKASTTNVTGNREQLLDIISLIEPEMTPVFSMARKKKATSTFPEWQVDSMEDPSFDGVDEGEDVSTFSNKRANSARLGNYIQKFRRSYQVSDIQELVDTAGVKSEFAYAKAKSVRELKRDVEAAICSSQDRQAQGGSGTPYKTRGFLRFLGYNGTAGNNYPSDIPADQQLTNYVDTGTALLEEDMNTVLQNLYTANGAPSGDYCFVGGTGARRDVTEFARSTTGGGSAYQVTESASAKKLTFTVTLYEGDFGIVKILPASLFVDRTSGSATLEADTALLIDTGAYSIFSLKAEASTELEDQGGGRRGFCEMICALGMESPKSHGFFYT